MPFKKEKGWPTDGEIDIMEHGQHLNYITQTQHSSYTKNNPNADPERFTKVKINKDSFNVYGVEIFKDRIDYYVNYQRTFSYPGVDSLLRQGQLPFYRDWFLLLNTNIGANPSLPIDSSALPIQLETDWIKYYRLNQIRLRHTITISMIKVLFVCTVPTDKSGIPNVIFNLLSKIDTRKYEIGYVSINEPPEFFKKKLQKINAKLYVIPRKLSNPFSYIKNLSKVAREYNIIHVHGNSATMVLEMIAAKMGGVKTRIAHSHNTTCSMKTIDRLARPLFYSLCNGHLACGIEAGKWLFGNREFTVINNGIDVDKFRFDESVRNAVRASFGVKDEFVIGHIGNFVEQKNHSFLIDLFHKFLEVQPHSKLLLLGNGPLMSSIKSKVNDSGINDNVIFMGSVDKPEKYMSVMDVIVMPSLFEGLPLTLIEEQANGLSILASDTITQESNITGLVTFKSLNDSPEEWAFVLNEILSRNINRNITSENSISKIKEKGYDILESSTKLYNYYKTICKTH